jgi:ABC-type nickel/cobalt efflux system permease component RcnA
MPVIIAIFLCGFVAGVLAGGAMLAAGSSVWMMLGAYLVVGSLGATLAAGLGLALAACHRKEPQNGQSARQMRIRAAH